MKTYNFIHMLNFSINIKIEDTKEFFYHFDSLCKDLRLDAEDFCFEDFYYVEDADGEEFINNCDTTFFEEDLQSDDKDTKYFYISIRNDHKNKLTTEWLDKLQQLHDKYNKD